MTWDDLVEAGMPVSRISREGNGETFYLTDNTNEQMLYFGESVDPSDGTKWGYDVTIYDIDASDDDVTSSQVCQTWYENLNDLANYICSWVDVGRL